MAIFNWLAAVTEAKPGVSNLSIADQILSHCEVPTTLSTLSDRLGMPYSEIAPAITELIAQGKITTTFLMVGNLNCIHYFKGRQSCRP